MKKLILLMLLCPSIAFGQQQYFRIQGTVQTPLGAAVAGASVAICSQPATTTTTPCSPLATLYGAANSNSTTLAGATYATQQITFTLASVPSDVVAGSYINVTGASPSTFNGVWLVSSVSAPSVVISNVFTNPGTYSSGGTVTTSAMPNPVTTDGNGYYFAYVVSNPYTVQMYSPLLLTQFHLDQYPTGCAPGAVNCGGGGGGGSPAGPAGTIQSTDGAGNFTASAIMQGTNGVLQNNVVENIAGSLDVGGPRPWIDVTGYGAQGDGSTNDTSAIQSAINAACAFTIGGLFIHPEIILPPGLYALAQAQGGAGNITPIFELPCSGLTFRGMGTSALGQFTRPPSTEILVQTLGANPSDGPVFDCRYPTCLTATFINLEIAGYNKAMWFYTANDDKLENVTLAVQNTGHTDNVPLMLSNMFWFEWHGGGWLTTASNYGVLMTGSIPLGSEAPLGGLFRFTDLQGAGGGFHYDQRVNTTGSGPGNMEFDNIRAIEAGSTPMLYITNSTGNPGSSAMPSFSDVTMNNVTTADWTGLTAAIELNSSGTSLTGVIIDMSQGGAGGPAIQVDAGKVQACNIRGGTNAFSSSSIVDSNGNALAGCASQTWNGVNYGVAAQNVTGGGDERVRSDIVTSGGSTGPFIAGYYAGNRFAGIALDPVYGAMFGTGTAFGFGAGINQTVTGDLDVNFPTVYPPTSVAGAATTGGAIALGTYYLTVFTSTSSVCTTPSQLSAPSIQSAAVVVSGGNDAITVSWATPVGGVSAISGFCVAASTTPNLNAGQWIPNQTNATYIAGAGTTSLLLTVLPTTGGPMTVVSTLTPVHRFTPTALGVGTVSPLANSLTVAGGLACALTVKSSAYSLTSADCKVNVTGTTTITLPHANTQSVWDLNNTDTSLTMTVVADSGNVNGAGSITLTHGVGGRAYCDGTNCWVIKNSSTGGGSPAGANYAIQYYSAGAFAAVASPTTPNGVPQTLVSVPSGGAATAPVMALPGITSRNDSTGIAIASTDCNPGAISYQGSSNLSVSLPTPTTLAVPNCTFIAANNTTGSATTVTITPVTYTLSVTGVGTGLTSYAIPKGTTCRFYPDASASIWDGECFQNSNANLTQTIASGTAVLGTGSISSATCATVVTVSASGVLTTDDIMADFNADPTSTTGYSPSASGMLTIIKYPTLNNVNFKVCNLTSSSITPGAVTLNWRVVR